MLEEAKVVLKIRKELLYSIIVMFPYIEIFIGGTKAVNDGIIRTIVVAEVGMIVLFMLFYGLLKINNIEMLFCMYTIVNWICNAEWKFTSICLLTWIIIPIILASYISIFLSKKKLNKIQFVTHEMDWFIVFVIVLIIFNLFFLNVDYNGRLVAPAGGPVIFGYTVAIYFAVIMHHREMYSARKYLLYKIILTVAAVMSGSRGAVWPVAAMWIIDFLRYKKITIKRLVFCCIAFSLLIFINPIEYVYKMMPRLFVSTSNTRMLSNESIFTLMRNFSFKDIVLGKGLENFFPYQEWVNGMVIDSSSYVGRSFIVQDGVSFIVQPHNTFIYILVELGIVGLILFSLIFIKYFVRGIKNHNMTAILVLFVIIFVNLFDSVMIVEPGVALILWVLIMNMDIGGKYVSKDIIG